MKNERSKWICATMLALAACEPRPGDDGEESEVGEVGGSEVGGDLSETESESATSTSGTTGADPSCTTYAEEGSASATVTSAGTVSFTGSGDDEGGEDEGGGGAAEQCGVELVYDGSQTSFMCGCEDCNVQYDGLSPESGEALIDACDCICAVVDCGGSVSGGVTTNAEDDGGSYSGTGESGWGGEVDSGWGGESGDTESASGTGTSGAGNDDG